MEFNPDIMPFDAADLELHIHFWEQGPSGKVQAGFSPHIDWSMWNIPLLGNKPRKLRMTSVGAFHEMSVDIRYKSAPIEWRVYSVK